MNRSKPARPIGWETPVPDPSPVGIAGIMRFSVIARDQLFFRADRDRSFDERCAALFDEARLAARFRLLEAVSLPSLAAQTDPGFTLCLVTSSLLPPRWQDRLDALAARHPFLAVTRHDPEERLHRSCRAAASAAIQAGPGKAGTEAGSDEGPGTALRCTFRIDDDDALAADFVARLRENAVRIAPPAALSFRTGWMLMPGSGGVRLCPSVNFGVACGLALVQGAEENSTVLDIRVKHRQVDRAYPTLTDSRSPAFLVTAHPHCDSLRAEQGFAWEGPFAPAEARETLGPAFATLDMEDLARW